MTSFGGKCTIMHFEDICHNGVRREIQQKNHGIITDQHYLCTSSFRKKALTMIYVDFRSYNFE